MEKLIRNTRVLVTGGAGFIGSNLVEALLQQDNEVVCLDNFSTGKRKNIEPFLQNNKFTLVEGDIRNLTDCNKAVEGVGVVLHQAALGSVPRSVKDPVTTNSVNIDGFLNMLVASRDAGVGRFVYASSSSVYGDHPGLPKVEKETGNLLSPYAVTKKVNELYAGVFAGLYGMETIGLRYFNVFGKRQDPEGQYAAVIPRFIRSLIRHSRPEIYGDGLQSRDFTYIDNVVHANQAAALAPSASVNTVYNIAFSERITLNELFGMLRDNLACFDSEIAGIEPKYVSERPGDIRHSLASIDKATELIGYQPQFPVREGLKKAISWYWENLK
ncbi:MAG TPA: SDR family oxidoreductase [Bacteroidales bacterium]|nr:SDR family oxidoreductase [Bacteroidales bacterium]